MATASTVLFRARVPADRLKRVEKILERLGMKVLSSNEQATAWTEALGDY